MEAKAKEDAAKNEVQYFEERLRGQLREFISDSSVQLEFEPMDKFKMFICHEVVEDFPDLIALKSGEGDDRHIVVYKKGFEPEDLVTALSVDVDVVQPLRTANRSKKNEEDLKPVRCLNFV